MLACGSGHAGCVALLLRHKANVKAVNDFKWAPITFAAENGFATVIDTLIESHADVNVATESKVTPFMAAARRDKLSAARTLLKAKADINAEDSFGNSPLCIGCELGASVVCNELLVKHMSKMSASVSNRDQWTCAHWAARFDRAQILGHFDVIQANLDARNRYNATPLLLAAMENKVAAAATLLRMGAALSVTDNAGRSVLHYAAERGFTSLVALFLTEEVLSRAMLHEEQAARDRFRGAAAGVEGKDGGEGGGGGEGAGGGRRSSPRLVSRAASPSSRSAEREALAAFRTKLLETKDAHGPYERTRARQLQACVRACETAGGHVSGERERVSEKHACMQDIGSESFE